MLIINNIIYAVCVICYTFANKEVFVLFIFVYQRLHVCVGLVIGYHTLGITLCMGPNHALPN